MVELAPQLRAEHFSPAISAEGKADPRTAEYIRAYTYGFYGPEPSDQRINQIASYWVKDQATLTAVYPHPVEHGAEAAYGFGASFPVGTFFTALGTTSTGDKLIPTLKCTYATVSPAYRRRGILRYMMTEALRRGKEQGAAMASLIATEGTIYQRFGFGVATRVKQITVTTDSRFHLNISPTGRVFTADPAKIGALAEELFRRFHASTQGSISQSARYSDVVSGAMLERDDSTMRAKLRVAIYCNPDGDVDGLVVYTVKELDDHFQMGAEIVDMVTTTSQAYLQLWDFLGSQDLVTQIKWDRAPVDDALPHVMQDPRLYKVEAQNDHSWNRVLDLKTAFEAKRWGTDGQCILKVHDDLGFTDGLWLISVTDGQGECTEIEATDMSPGIAYLELSAQQLVPLLSGDQSIEKIAQAQQLILGESTGGGPFGDISPVALQNVKMMFNYGQKPYSMTYF